MWVGRGGLAKSERARERRNTESKGTREQEQGMQRRGSTKRFWEKDVFFFESKAEPRVYQCESEKGFWYNDQLGMAATCVNTGHARAARTAVAATAETTNPLPATIVRRYVLLVPKVYTCIHHACGITGYII